MIKFVIINHKARESFLCSYVYSFFTILIATSWILSKIKNRVCKLCFLNCGDEGHFDLQ